MKRNSNYNDSEGLMNTIIGKDAVIDGQLNVEGSLRIDGKVKGKVVCTDCVTVGATGLVQAEIESGSAIIAGKMVGNVIATEKIELQAKCEMEGNLRTKSLVIEQGAVFCGACNMKDTPQTDLGFLTPEDREAAAVISDDENEEYE